MKYLLVPIFLLLIVSCKTKTKQESITITSTEVKEMVSFLASDDINGRDTGSEGIAEAATYIEKQLASFGVKPYYKAYRDHFNVKDLDELSDLAPISSDRLNVRAYERKNVLVNGAVKFPGNYAISNGETLYSIVQKAGGYNKNAYPFGGILNNKKALELNEKAVESLYTTFVQKLVTKGDPLFASESLPFALKELKKADTSGRIIAEFDLSVLKKNPELDTILDDGDEIIIPIQTQQVYIFGEVNNDGAIRYYPKHDIKQYISRAGGVTESADSEYIYVVHPNGEVNKFANNKISFFTNRSNDILVYPGSVIYVPRKVNSQEAAMVASIWAPIVSAMATSITALSVLDRN